MKTRLEISFEIEHSEELQRLCKAYRKKVGPGLMLTLIDAMQDPHCYFGDGGDGMLFMWGYIGGIENYYIEIFSHFTFWHDIKKSVVSGGSPITILTQGLGDGNVTLHTIYGTTENGSILEEFEELSLDWVVYNL